jgi:RsiW-degrading membrane proteinase PrsW (M82 family)
MENLIDCHTGWQEEIIREMEHYYQGELRQEERASWLLGIVSAMITLLISSFTNCTGSFSISETSFQFIICSLVLSAIFSIITILPYKGKNVFSLEVLFKEKLDPVDESHEEFVRNKLKADKDWSDESLQRRIIFHYIIHYQRNFRKSQTILWSIIFFLVGFLCLVITVLIK